MSQPVVVGYGLGVDSTAMLIGWRRRGLPVPSLILTADTGDEKEETWRFLPGMQDWLRRQNYPQVTVIKRKSPIAGDTSLSGECLRKSVLPSLAYGGHSCSLKWKVDPQWAFCREYFGWQQARRKKGETVKPKGSWRHGPSITKLIGYDAGPADARRIKNAVGKWPPGHDYVYPLVEWGWDRRACTEVIISEGLPGWDPQFLQADLVTFSEMRWIERGGIPIKSACWMCPASKKAEIDWMARFHPENAERAALMEAKAAARGLRTTRGLGRSFNWTEYLNPPLLAAMRKNVTR